MRKKYIFNEEGLSHRQPWQKIDHSDERVFFLRKHSRTDFVFVDAVKDAMF